MKKRMILALAMASLIPALAFANGSKESPATTATPTGEETVDYSQELVVYTNSGSSGRAEWLTERAAKEGFKLTIVSGGAGEITNRVLAEKNNPVADVIYGLNSLKWFQIKNEDLLLPYRPSWAGQVDSSLGDNETFFPIVAQPLVLIYNRDMPDPPAKWDDLLKPQYKNRFTMLRLAGGTAQTMLAGLCTRFRDDKGVEGVSQEGWDFIKALYQNAHVEIHGEDYVGSLVDGSMPVSEMWGSGVIQYQKERNTTFGIVLPEEGEPYVVEQVGILKSSKHPALAKAFVDWFGSAEIQAEWCQKFGTIPAQPKALATASEDVKAFANACKAQPMDWTWVSEHLDAWVEKVELEFL